MAMDKSLQPDVTLRYLFVCVGGVDRSPTAAAAAKAMAKERGRNIETAYLGLYDAMTTNFLPPDYVNGFDRIFVMEPNLGRVLQEEWKCHVEIICLDVQDALSCYSLEDAQALDRIMRAKLEAWI